MEEKDVVSYNTMIGLCGSAKEMSVAETLWQEMLQKNMQPNLLVYTSMIKAYGQSGYVDKALTTLESMRAHCAPDAFTYAAAMSAVARTGDYSRTRELFVEMTSAGIAPSHHHFNSLLTSCASVGDASTAEAIFRLLPSYNLKPRVEDFTTLLACCRFDLERSR